MSSKVTGWAWDQDLPVQCKCVLLWLAERATENGVCFPGQPEIRQKTGLGESMVRRYLHGLTSDHDDKGVPKQPLIRIIHRPIAGDRNTSNVYVLLVPWAQPADVRRELEELKHVPRTVLREVGVAGAPQGGGVQPCARVGIAGAPQEGVAGDREEPSLPDRDREIPPMPPEGKQQQQQQQGVLMGLRPSDSRLDPTRQLSAADAAQLLASGFYRGLGSNVAGVTEAIRRRDMAIASQLVEAGATPAEGEAYARETSAAAGRIAPVDLRSFERERLGWLARRRGRDLTERRVVDRTGQPPSWQAGQGTASQEQPAPAVLEPPERAGPRPALDERNTPGVAGDQLAEKLRTVFRGGRP
ncbi:MAG: helix-turn-helix domain-containing protein [Chloroflexota bacterium]|nr:helix-turn-helix domain-containing protein [Chloroflexota bacterium]